MSDVKGRYAPSPSGRMHLGNVFTAVFSWIYARAENGEYCLRIEDLDPLRCSEEYAELIREDLRWIGIDWDTEAVPQSRRTSAYEGTFEYLRSRDLVYPCYCSRNDLHAASAPHNSDGLYVYPGTCRRITADDERRRNKKPSWRVIVPDREYSFVDGIRGPFSQNLEKECGDFIIRRADGVYAYQLAVVTDDGETGITQIVRGSDLISSTPRQLYLYELLALPKPDYYHLPLLCAPDGRRLSKRERDLSMDTIRSRLFPEQLLGYLAFVSGMHTSFEPLSLNEMLAEFRTHRPTFPESLTVEPDAVLKLSGANS